MLSAHQPRSLQSPKHITGVRPAITGYSRNMAHLLDMPAEILQLMSSSLTRGDRFCLTLTCKRLASVISYLSIGSSWLNALKNGGEFQRFVQAHLRVEAGSVGNIRYLICTACGKLKLRCHKQGFSDAQSEVHVLYRYCIKCQKGVVYVNGEELNRLSKGELGPMDELR